MARSIDGFRRKLLARRRGVVAYDEQMRAVALEYVRRARSEGGSWSAISRELGILIATLQAWDNVPSSRGDLRPFEREA